LRQASLRETEAALLREDVEWGLRGED
jgi:hypothetical protein